MESNKSVNGKICIDGDVKKFDAVNGTYVRNEEFLAAIDFDTSGYSPSTLTSIVYCLRIGKRGLEPHQLQRLDQLYQERCLRQEFLLTRLFKSVKKMFNY